MKYLHLLVCLSLVSCAIILMAIVNVRYLKSFIEVQAEVCEDNPELLPTVAVLELPAITPLHYQMKHF